MHASIAQLAEHSLSKRKVASSTLAGGFSKALATWKMYRIFVCSAFRDSAGSTVIVYVPATDETRVWFPAGAFCNQYFQQKR